jgi:predicted small secreted protein
MVSTIRTFAALAALAVLLAACINTSSAPGSSSGASVSPAGGTAGTSVAPASAGTSTAATLAPGTTASPAPSAPGTSGSPASSPTAPATVLPTNTLTPTDTPAPTPRHDGWPIGAIGVGAADNHVGETRQVCGAVVATNWVFGDPGHPTFLNLKEPYNHQVFNVVIWGEQRRKWPLNGKPDVVYLGKTICATGAIERYQTWLQIQNVAKSDIVVIN